MKNRDNRRDMIFIGLGGTWDQILKGDRLYGKGGIEEKTISDFEDSLGIYKENADVDSLEWKLSESLYDLILEKNKNVSDAIEALAFVPNIKNLIKGKFINLYSGDSSQFRTAFFTSLLHFILSLAWDNKDKTIVGVPGTDYIDISFLPILDTFLFDASLPAILFTSSNKGWRYEHSDAPQNFLDTINIADIDLQPGSYFVFADRVYNGSDIVKVSPMRKRMVDKFSSFYSPHLKAITVEEALKNPKKQFYKKQIKGSDHFTQKISRTDIFRAIKSVHITDLGQQNEISEDIKAITNPNLKAVIIAASSLGNVDNAVKYASIKAAKNNKLVIIVSRCLIGEVHPLDYSYLPRVNSQELKGTGKILISGHKLNKNVARALAIRAVLQNLNQKQTQDLFDRYTSIRGLSPQDIIVV